MYASWSGAKQLEKVLQFRRDIANSIKNNAVSLGLSPRHGQHSRDRTLVPNAATRKAIGAFVKLKKGNAKVATDMC